MYACDKHWWDYHYDKVLKQFKGELWTQHKAWGDAYLPKINVVESSDKPGLSTQDGIIHQGKNSGYQAINLAYMFGADRIILLGYDMTGNGSHWFGKHEGPGLSQSTNYESLISEFNTIDPPKYGIEIINCTRMTALNCFPKMSLESALSSALAPA